MNKLIIINLLNNKIIKDLFLVIIKIHLHKNKCINKSN